MIRIYDLSPHNDLILYHTLFLKNYSLSKAKALLYTIAVTQHMP